MSIDSRLARLRFANEAVMVDVAQNLEVVLETGKRRRRRDRSLVVFAAIGLLIALAIEPNLDLLRLGKERRLAPAEDLIVDHREDSRDPTLEPDDQSGSVRDGKRGIYASFGLEEGPSSDRRAPAGRAGSGATSAEARGESGPDQRLERNGVTEPKSSTLTAPYTALGFAEAGDCELGDGSGDCLEFAVPGWATKVEIEITDASGNVIRAYLQFHVDMDPQPDGEQLEVCGRTEEPAVLPGLASHITVEISSGLCRGGQTTSTTGRVTVRFVS